MPATDLSSATLPRNLTPHPSASSGVLGPGVWFSGQLTAEVADARLIRISSLAGLSKFTASRLVDQAVGLLDGREPLLVHSTGGTFQLVLSGDTPWEGPLISTLNSSTDDLGVVLVEGRSCTWTLEPVQPSQLADLVAARDAFEAFVTSADTSGLRPAKLLRSPELMIHPLVHRALFPFHLLSATTGGADPDPEGEAEQVQFHHPYPDRTPSTNGLRADSYCVYSPLLYLLYPSDGSTGPDPADTAELLNAMRADQYFLRDVRYTLIDDDLPEDLPKVEAEVRDTFDQLAGPGFPTPDWADLVAAASTAAD